MFPPTHQAALSAPEGGDALGDDNDFGSSSRQRGGSRDQISASGHKQALATWWSTPKPLHWAKQLMGWPSGVRQAYDNLPRTSAGPEVTALSESTFGGDPPSSINVAAFELSAEDCGAAAAVDRAHSDAVVLLQAAAEMETGVPHCEEEAATSSSLLPDREGIQALASRKQGQLALVLFPVTGLLLIARFITQTASKIVTVQIVGGARSGATAAAAMAGAAQVLRRRPASYAAYVTSGMPDGIDEIRTSASSPPGRWSILPWRQGQQQQPKIDPVPEEVASAVGHSAAPAWKKGWSTATRKSTSSETMPFIAPPKAVLVEKEADSMSQHIAGSTSLRSASSYPSFEQSVLPLAQDDDSPEQLSLPALDHGSDSALMTLYRSRSASTPDINHSPRDPSAKPYVPPKGQVPARGSHMKRSSSFQVGASSGSGGRVASSKPLPKLPLLRMPSSSSSSSALPRSSARQQRLQRPATLSGIAYPAGNTPPPSASANATVVAAAAASRMSIMPASTPCLDGSLVVHNMLAIFPTASPFVVLRALTAALRRQAARQRRSWWSSLVQQAASAVGPNKQLKGQRALKPAHPIVHFYNFLRGIPLWLRQRRRGQGELSFDHDWKALVIAASAADPTRLLQGRDFARMVLRAR